MKRQFIVELEEGVWIAPWEGDPDRTLKIESAKLYNNKTAAQKGLTESRKFRKFVNARILSVKQN